MTLFLLGLLFLAFIIAVVIWFTRWTERNPRDAEWEDVPDDLPQDALRREGHWLDESISKGDFK